MRSLWLSADARGGGLVKQTSIVEDAAAGLLNDVVIGGVLVVEGGAGGVDQGVGAADRASERGAEIDIPAGPGGGALGGQGPAAVERRPDTIAGGGDGQRALRHQIALPERSAAALHDAAAQRGGT